MSLHPNGAEQHFGHRSNPSTERNDSAEFSKAQGDSPFSRELSGLQKNWNLGATKSDLAASNESLQNRGLLPGLQLTDGNAKTNLSLANPASANPAATKDLSVPASNDGARQSINSSLAISDSLSSPSQGRGQSRVSWNDLKHGRDKAGRSSDSPAQAGGQPSQAELKGNEQKIMDYFMGKGLTRAQAAGIVGNIHQESGGDPNRRQMGGGPGYGLAQWEGSRKQDLARFAREQGKPISDLKTQLDFMYKELTSTESRAFRALKTATSPAQAADIFQRQYERASRPNTPNRIAHANRVFRSYGDSPTMIAER